jgi:hypothetical protein
MCAGLEPVVEIPGGAEKSVEVQGVLRLRLCFTSRSTTSAQDDSVFLGIQKEINE